MQTIVITQMMTATESILLNPGTSSSCTYSALLASTLLSPPQPHAQRV